jgi:predicted nucleic acid-binding protein
VGGAVKAVFDTNILIDYCLGIEQAKSELSQYSSHMISVITWIELMVGAKEKEETAIRAFLSDFEVIDIIPPIRELAITIRKKTKIRLPDAIILATAKHFETILVTRNTKDFPPESIDIRVPYSLS